MYAWTNFVTERNEWGQPTKTIEAGDTVTREDLDVSEEQWAHLIKNGQVRPQPYPPIPSGVSPATHFRSQEARMYEGKMTMEDVEEMQKRTGHEAARELGPDTGGGIKLPI